MSAAPQVNEFFDINKFPKEQGITYLGLSMPLLNNVQSPEACYQADLDLIAKIQVSNVGAQIVYTDNLYLYSSDPAMELKLKHQKLIEEHKQGWLNLIKQNIYIIPSAFTFMTWGQLLLECPRFSNHLTKLHQIFENDSLLQKYVHADIVAVGREISKYTIGYILEEILLDYMVVKGQVRLHNDYTRDKEEWILNCYHGKPHRSHVYLHQKNFFGLENKKNIYENSWYDLLNKKLYVYDRLDIETFDFLYKYY